MCNFAEHHEERSRRKTHTSPNKAANSLHSLDISPPQLKKQLLEEMRASDPNEDTRRKTVPQEVVRKVKSLLLANKSGIWVSRFLMEYKVHVCWCSKPQHDKSFLNGVVWWSIKPAAPTTNVALYQNFVPMT